LKVSGWLAARCRGQQQIPHRPANQRVFAHTSPVYVAVAGQPALTDPAAVAGLAHHLDQALGWVNREGRFENDAQRERLAGIFRSAREHFVKRTR
jgi:hypothetical protein